MIGGGVWYGTVSRKEIIPYQMHSWKVFHQNASGMVKCISDGHSAQGDHPSQSDVFVYKAYYTDIFDKSHEVIGDVTIIY